MHFRTRDDMEYALRKLDGSDFRNPFEKSRISVSEGGGLRFVCLPRHASAYPRDSKQSIRIYAERKYSRGVVGSNRSTPYACECRAKAGRVEGRRHC